MKNLIFPNLLQQANALDYDYKDGNGIDFEPYTEFLSQDDVTTWLKAWTGNKTVEFDELYVFGQDGTGGYAAIWIADRSKDFLNNPIIFLGSEGELGIVASNFYDYLWVLASGHGPSEAVNNLDVDRESNEVFMKFAETHSRTKNRPVAEIRESANILYPGFIKRIDNLCQ